MQADALVIESDAAFRALMVQALHELLGPRAHIAAPGGAMGPADPATALPGAANLRLAVVDAELADWRSAEFVSLLAPSGCRVLVSCGRIDEAQLFELTRRGADAFCLKGDGLDELVAILRGLQAGAPWLHRSTLERMLVELRREDIAPARRLGEDEAEALTYLARGFTVDETASLMMCAAPGVIQRCRAALARLRA